MSRDVTAPVSRIAVLLVAALVVVGLSVWAFADAGSGPASGSRAADPAAASDERPGAGSVPPLLLSARPAVPAQSQVNPEPPTSIRLPSGVELPVRAASTRGNGLLDVPDDPRLAGWWEGGSSLGDPFGSTLLAAHVDSRTLGLGPYAEVLTLRPADVLTVRSRHLVQRFRLDRLRLVDQGPLGGEPWIYSPRGARRLVLVTCAPPYDPARGGYQQLVVAVARPVGPPARAGQR